jgi:hypothetical protein
MVADRRFGQTENDGEIAADLLAGRRTEKERHDLDSDRIGQRLQA